MLVVENGITRVTQTRQSDIDEGQTTEMGSKWTIPYALYRGVIHFSAPLAARAKVTHDDLDEALHHIRSPGVPSLSHDVVPGSSTESFCNTPPGVSCSLSLLL